MLPVKTGSSNSEPFTSFIEASGSPSLDAESKTIISSISEKGMFACRG